MANKQTEVDEKALRMTTIQSAVAIQLHASGIPPTAKQCFQKLTDEVKKWLNEPTLEMKQLAAVLEEWFRKGWAKLEETVFRVTREGRVHIKALAEKATAATPA